MSQNHVYYLAANEMFDERKIIMLFNVCGWVPGFFLPKPTGVPISILMLDFKFYCDRTVYYHGCYFNYYYCPLRMYLLRSSHLVLF